ncbi:MAG TPA: kelch repeat-containing protein [Thermoplasmata archaeon]|nr:kelch repeat-containing protein [Thermoplasmata archaeon]
MIASLGLTVCAIVLLLMPEVAAHPGFLAPLPRPAPAGGPAFVPHPHGTWSNVTGVAGIAPPSRVGAASTFDGADGYLVLFGGLTPTGIFLGDSWAFQNSSWHKLSPKVHPPPRAYASLTYDAIDHYVLLFGGRNRTGSLGDTWEFRSGHWTALSPATRPPARNKAAMTYDVGDSYALLFGGNTSGGDLNDTWTFAMGAWHQLNISGPCRREGAAMAYFASGGYVILESGWWVPHSSALTACTSKDTWGYSRGVWRIVFRGTTTPITPEKRVGPAFAANDTVAVLWGGSNTQVSFRPYLTWTFFNGTWFYNRGANPPPGPGAFAYKYPVFAWDAAARYFVFYNCGATWTYA